MTYLHNEKPVLAVVGTGRMGASIARALAAADLTVHLLSREVARASKLALVMTSELSGTVTAGRLADLQRVGPEMVIECVPEDRDIKIEILSQIEDLVSSEVVIATNTSSLLLADLANGLKDSTRFVGLHFLYPADMTFAIEIVPGDSTSEHVIDYCRRMVTNMGRYPITVRRELPGFVWNRLQFALLREAVYLVEEGVASAEEVDMAVTRGLAPRWVAAGPLMTARLGGLALFQELAERLYPTLCNARHASGLARAESLNDYEDGSGLSQGVEFAGAWRDLVLRELAKLLARLGPPIAMNSTTG